MPFCIGLRPAAGRSFAPVNSDCIIFDCDGVLVDSEPITFGVLVELLAEAGLPMTYDEVAAAFLGKAFSYITAYVERGTGRPLDAAAFEAEFRRRTFARFRTDIRPVDGIRELLDEVNVPVCVASSGPPHKIRLNLELTGLAPYFGERIFSCYDLGRWKPDPAVFLHAAATLGFRPEQCTVVEDSPVGVAAAVAGGFRVFGLARHGNDALLAAAGARVVHHLSQLRTNL